MNALLRRNVARWTNPLLSRVYRTLPTLQWQPIHFSKSFSTDEAIQQKKVAEIVPHYHCTFTCKVCQGRSSHKMSKEAYHNGVVIIRCPTCDNLHLMADHLGWFSNKKRTIEDIMAEQGEQVKRDQTFEFVVPSE
eukprot:TRINITY_DN9506_c0_g1_i1.p1 TRINITY_DN9506_c0_g1~~TRINITY_DN9506_c0_g1_i1.p1  ORF type:complete len:135 (-),score=12.36 TRINITY_DN9506_c0_g1_i1:117-521(-)